MAEEAKPIQDIFHLEDVHYGSPLQSNPYLHVSMLRGASIEEAWTDTVSKYKAAPVTIEAKASYKDVGTALVTPKTKKGSVPSVTVIAERFAVNVKSGEDIPLAAFFYPPLHDIEGSALKALISELHKDLHVLFTIATTHHLSMKDSPSTNHFELTNEQLLFTNILKALMNSLICPCVIHSQCQTKQHSEDVPNSLPSVRFDLMVNVTGGEPSEFSVIVQVNGQSEEKPELIVSNKTDTSINLHKLNAEVGLEALIAAEVSKQESTRLVNATKSFVRPLMREKSSDLLFTTPTVVQWCGEESGQLQFELPGCILLLLFLRAGMGNYPKYCTSMISDLINPDEHQCGWNEGYSNCGVQYSNRLQQTRPNVPPLSRGRSLKPANLVADCPVGDWITELKSRKRHRSS